MVSHPVGPRSANRRPAHEQARLACRTAADLLAFCSMHLLGASNKADLRDVWDMTLDFAKRSLMAVDAAGRLASEHLLRCEEHHDLAAIACRVPLVSSVALVFIVGHAVDAAPWFETCAAVKGKPLRAQHRIHFQVVGKLSGRLTDA